MRAPVTYSPGFVPGDHVDRIWDTMPWENREGAPRYEAWMNDYALPYTYGHGEHARTYEAMPAWHPMVDALRDWINFVLDARFDCCFVNGYAHGRQHLGWHADDSPEMDMDHPIAVVSFGAEREIWFRPKLAPGFNRSQNVTDWGLEKQLLGNGSMLVMHAGMQREWQHRIPKSPVADCGRRVSLTFRKLVLA